jgi:hypothetical protein
MGDDGACADDASAADGDSFEDDDPAANPCTLLNCHGGCSGPGTGKIVFIGVCYHNVPRNHRSTTDCDALMAHDHGVSVEVGTLTNRENGARADLQSDSTPERATPGTQFTAVVDDAWLREATLPRYITAVEVRPQKQSRED